MYFLDAVGVRTSHGEGAIDGLAAKTDQTCRALSTWREC